MSRDLYKNKIKQREKNNLKSEKKSNFQTNNINDNNNDNDNSLKNNNNIDNNLNTRRLLPFFSESSVRRNFRHQHDMRKFILSALIECDKDFVFQILNSDDGLDRIHEISVERFDLDAGISSRQVSFQRVAIPLCALLSHNDIIVAMISNNRNVELFNALSPRFYTSIFENLKDLCQSPEKLFDLEENNTDQTTFSPTTLIDIILPICDLFLSRIQLGNDDKYIAQDLNELSNVLTNIKAMDSKQSRFKQKTLNDLNRAQLQLNGDGKHFNFDKHIASLPGSLNKNGSRHNNDKVNEYNYNENNNYFLLIFSFQD